MEPSKILSADILDIVFEGRNKEYGAYDLRKKYNKRITMALVITASVAALVVGATFLSKALAPSSDNNVEVKDVALQNIQEAPPPPPPPPPPPKAPPPPPQLETAKFTPPVIKKDEEVQKQEIPPVDDLDKVVISDKTTEGIKDDGLLNTPVVDEGTKIVAEKPVDENEIFTKVEIEASVNIPQWRRHLENQLQRYIDDASSSGMQPGVYTINVRFLVEKDGSINSVQALNDPGFGLATGAVEVVKRGPKWTPGEQNGKKVRSYHTQPISFQIQEQ
jgi:protein TonB